MKRSRNAAIILSAGKGSRMNSDIHKQYMELCGKPVIYYALKAFDEHEEIDEIILVTGEGEQDYCKREIIERYGIQKVKAVIAGGKERYDSVYAGLCAIESGSNEENEQHDICDYVLIHDGARPLVSADIITRNLEKARETGACITAVSVKDTIKVIDQEGKVVSTPDRRSLITVQTPQTFRYDLILQAHRKLREQGMDGITDDAMVVEKVSGQSVYVAEGEYTNIKITTPEDLFSAQQFLQNRSV